MYSYDEYVKFFNKNFPFYHYTYRFHKKVECFSKDYND